MEQDNEATDTPPRTAETSKIFPMCWSRVMWSIPPLGIRHLIVIGHGRQSCRRQECSPYTGGAER